MKTVMPGSDADYARKLRLPASTNWPTAKPVWTMQGFKLVNRIRSTSSGREATVILRMINKMR
jgi:hypothetical protein